MFGKSHDKNDPHFQRMDSHLTRFMDEMKELPEVMSKHAAETPAPVKDAVMRATMAFAMLLGESILSRDEKK